jgi:hypothetical protein
MDRPLCVYDERLTRRLRRPQARALCVGSPECYGQVNENMQALDLCMTRFSR